jgi:hypothetical protein
VPAVPIVLLLMGPQAQAYWGDGFRFGNGDGFAVKMDGAEVNQGITQASLMPNQSFNPTLDILRIRRIVVIHGSINNLRRWLSARMEHLTGTTTE